MPGCARARWNRRHRAGARCNDFVRGLRDRDVHAAVTEGDAHELAGFRAECESPDRSPASVLTTMMAPRSSRMSVIAESVVLDSPTWSAISPR